MFTYRRQIFIADTDATGVIYFAKLPQIALEAFEVFVGEAGIHLGEMLEKEGFLLPIVHTSANYTAAVRLGDVVEAHLSLAQEGTSSFRLRTTFTPAIGDVEIVHVVLSKETGASMPIPPKLHALLHKLN
jgi:1,4-dihydroxy-2-naphthoyl-CoA hydrolase